MANRALLYWESGQTDWYTEHSRPGRLAVWIPLWIYGLELKPRILGWLATGFYTQAYEQFTPDHLNLYVAAVSIKLSLFKRPSPLSEIQIQIVQHLSYGVTKSEVAEKLDLSTRTISNHLHRLRDVNPGKPLRTETQVVAYCLRQGWIT